MLHQERELLKFSRNIFFTLRKKVVKEVKESDVGIAQLRIRNRKKSQLIYPLILVFAAIQLVYCQFIFYLNIKMSQSRVFSKAMFTNCVSHTLHEIYEPGRVFFQIIIRLYTVYRSKFKIQSASYITNDLILQYSRAVIVYIFGHQHTSYRIENFALQTNWIQKVERAG